MREGECEYIREFKERMNEILFLQKKHHEIIDSNPREPTDSTNIFSRFTLPVNFSTENRQILAHLHMLINNEFLAIPNDCDKLIISLGTAYAK